MAASQIGTIRCIDVIEIVELLLPFSCALGTVVGLPP
jgi:hypothetical protein